MIQPPHGWRVDVRGDAMLLIPPQGQEFGGIRYAERVRPLAPATIVARGLPAPAAYRLESLGAPERLTTFEGEHAALLTAQGTLDGQPLERTIGLVFGDDFYALTVGHARVPEARPVIQATVRGLIETDAHMLGVRRRRFVYDAPAGWIGLPVGPFHTQWVPPGHPRDASALTVFPALPVPPGERHHARTLVADLVARSSAGNQVDLDEPLTIMVGKLTGSRWEVRTRGTGDLVHDLVILEDARYAYPIALASAPARRAANLEALEHVLATIEPVPRQGSRHAEPPPLTLSHWVD